MKMSTWFAATLLVVCFARCLAENKTFAVQNSIEMSTFTDPSEHDHIRHFRESPNGNYFLAVTSRGLLDRDEVESVIWVFDKRAIRSFLLDGNNAAAPSPRRVARSSAVPVTVTTDLEQPIISDPRWAPDSRSIYFLKQESTGLHRLCRVDLKTGGTHVLSRQGDDVEQYSLSKHLVVFTTHRSYAARGGANRDHTDSASTSPRSVAGVPLAEILFPKENSAYTLNPQPHGLWVFKGGSLHKVMAPSDIDIQHDRDVLAVSPRGDEVVQIKPALNIPPGWDAYTPLTGYETRHIKHDDPKLTSPTNPFRVRQYVSVDLTTGRVHPLVDAPIGDVLAYGEQARAVWAPDGKRLLLTTTFLPLDGADQLVRTQRQSNVCSVAEVEIPTNAVSCIAWSRTGNTPTPSNPTPLWFDSVSFGKSDDEVVLRRWRLDNTLQTETYRRSSGQWALTSEPLDKAAMPAPDTNSLRKNDPIAIIIKQGLNEPPVLWATDPSTGTSRAVWNPNPQMIGLNFGVASIYHWKDQTGFEWAGGLVKPVDYVQGRRYPLVIQTHGFRDFEFMTYGQYPTGMAARPLASAGIMVLQVQTNHLHAGQPEELTDYVRAYESAITQLTSDGLIDPSRVGIVGFSRTCWYVESVLIAKPNLFAAASINDGIDQSYMQAMLFDPGQMIGSESDRLYKAKPFGEGLTSWLHLAPTFQANKIQTPVMITAITPPSVMQEWEIYSSLHQQNKPVDLFYIPNDQHILQRPSNVFASEQGTVDWFRFWLQGYERPELNLAEQYARWRSLREMQHKSPQMAGNP
jgi:dipeptidyl aminopeptidase/acylaminoacyl peptidase